MDQSPPPSSLRSEPPRSRTKSAPRLLLLHSSDEFGENFPPNIPRSPPKKRPSRTRQAHQPSSPPPIRDLLLLSPSPLRRAKNRLRLLDRPDAGAKEDALAALDHFDPSRRSCRTRGISSSLMFCSPPRSARRGRRRVEYEMREERDLGPGEDEVKVRKRRQSRRVSGRREKPGSIPSVPSPSPCPKNEVEDFSSSENVCKWVSELVMWKDTAKSTLWFGFGSIFFLSSWLAGGLSFSIVSAISQMGLLFLAMTFFYSLFSPRIKDEGTPEFKLKEEDIVRMTRAMLPAANAGIALTKELFSGEPSMTLKVAPILIFASEYGHLFTVWRLLAIGFFVGFTAPKLFSRYSSQIKKKVEYLRFCAWDAWEACSHKRIVGVSAAFVFWNLSSFRTRIFAGFILIVTLRYCHHKFVGEAEGEEEEEEQLLEPEVSSEKDQPLINA